MYIMSEKTKKNVERATGLSMDKIKAMSVQEEQQWVEQKTQQRLIFSKEKKYGIIGRGNPLLARRKIRTAADIEDKSREIFGL